jgi:hypothetical protein
VGGDNIGGWPGQPTSSFFAGTLADVAVYPTALSQTRVRAHWTASGRVAPPIVTPADAYGAAVYNDEPLQYWRLDETSGTTLADASNNNATGLVQGTPTLGVSGALGATGKAIALTARRTSRPPWRRRPRPRSPRDVVQHHLADRRQAHRLRCSQTTGAAARTTSVYMTNDGHLVFGV